MTPIYSLLSGIFQVLVADEGLLDIVGATGIFVGTQKPKGMKNPVVHLWANSAENPSVAALHTAMIDVVARTDTPDGEGSQLAGIFACIDTLMNDVFFSTTSASGRVNRRGIVVPHAFFDEVEKDYVKHWRYRVIVKSIN
jgi:hypothetical protein